MGQLDHRFRDNPAQKAEVARAFLDEANCPGARGLSEDKKADLLRLRDAISTQPTPGTASGYRKRG